MVAILFLPLCVNTFEKHFLAAVVVKLSIIVWKIFFIKKLGCADTTYKIVMAWIT